MILQLLRGMYKGAELSTGVRKPSQPLYDEVVTLPEPSSGSCRDYV